MTQTNLWKNEYNPFNKWKVLAWYDRLQAIKNWENGIGTLHAPVNIALDLIQGTESIKKCGGHRCNFCMSNLEDTGKEAIIPYEVALKLPKFFHDWGVKSICIPGHHSDPLMYNNDILSQFLYLCLDYKIEVGFVSNGALYNDKSLKFVAETSNWSGWSINAGSREIHEKITGTKTFERILKNMSKMRELCIKHKLNHDIGYKFLITDDNYTEIYLAAKLAKENGARHFQIRPCELPLERSNKIDVSLVEESILKTIDDLEVKGEFEVFGIREKFTPTFTKKVPRRCISSPLGSTWKADGNIVICPDRRWSYNKDGMVLGNFITDGLDKIKELWGSEKHRIMIQKANKDLENCIRCTSWHWHDIFENVIEEDLMDITLI